MPAKIALLLLCCIACLGGCSETDAPEAGEAASEPSETEQATLGAQPCPDVMSEAAFRGRQETQKAADPNHVEPARNIPVVEGRDSYRWNDAPVVDEHGRMPSYSKVAVAAIVGNEDGAHSVTAELFQALNDEGWTIAASGACYWVGEAMHKTDLKDLDRIPEEVTRTARLVAGNAVHLARLLKERPYPGALAEQGKAR